MDLLPQRDILGVQVVAIDRASAFDLLAQRISARRFTKVGFLNAFSANVANENDAFRAAMADFLVLPDGFGVDIASKALYGAQFPENLNGTDFVPALIQHLPGTLTIGLIGSVRDNVEAAADRLARMAPQHHFEVISDGFFDQAGEAGILARLKHTPVDILLVAMGVPRQEFWIERLSNCHTTLAIAVGALFDFLSGAVPRAPQWMRGARLEWLFRLIIEPRRLWARYIVGNPLFLAWLGRQWMRERVGR
jgi:exopolysaccharide biosynthesis WecB/TagA/CpsF family protein